MISKIAFVAYTLLSICLVYTRIIDDFSLYKLVKYSLIPSLIAFYFFSSQKIIKKFILVLLLYYAADVVFTIGRWYQYFGFSFLFIANMVFILYFLNRLKIVASTNFYKLFFIIIGIIAGLVTFFYNTSTFQFFILRAFYFSIAFLFIVSYYHYLKESKIHALWMFLSVMSFVVSNFISSLNYFIYKNPYFSGFSSLTYTVFVFGVTYSVILENKVFYNKVRVVT